MSNTKPVAKFCAIVTILHAMAATASALAQDQACTCRVPLPAKTSDTVGSLNNPNGSVTVSTAKADPEVVEGQVVPLTQTSRVSVGPQSSASMMVGTACSLQLPQNVNTCFVPHGDSLCVRVVDAGRRCQTAKTGVIPAIAIGGSVVAGAAVGVTVTTIGTIAAAAVAGVIGAIASGDDGPSPVSP